ncbi:MAG: hypothetical protein U0163_08000 [Gemmatimonadaceae bacterium]
MTSCCRDSSLRRSCGPPAHAKVRSVDTSKAKKMPGVEPSIQGADLKAGSVNPLPRGWLHADIKIGEHMPMATDKVRFVGNAVAVVIADHAARARAADAVDVDYEVLPGVADATAALAAGAPRCTTTHRERRVQMGVRRRSRHGRAIRQGQDDREAAAGEPAADCNAIEPARAMRATAVRPMSSPCT